MPVMIGWSAVTGTIGWQALAMFAIIFFWTPPHTWALAMKYKEDYRAAGVPMLPVVATERQVTTPDRHLHLADGGGHAGADPGRGLAVRGGGGAGRGWFLTLAHRLHAGVRRGEAVKPLKLFLQSNNYLAAVFCALAVDSVIALPLLFG